MAISLQSSKVRTSLLTSLTTFGVDDWWFVLNLCISIMVIVPLRFYTWALIALALHGVLMVVTRVSPQILECYVKHMRQATRYSPYANPLQVRNLRPAGFGRGEV